MRVSCGQELLSPTAVQIALQTFAQLAKQQRVIRSCVFCFVGSLFLPGDQVSVRTQQQMSARLQTYAASVMQFEDAQLQACAQCYCAVLAAS